MSGGKKKTLAFQSFILVTGFVATTWWMFNLEPFRLLSLEAVGRD